jgi:ribosome-binding protein aMBF1 (putative translation factor)
MKDETTNDRTTNDKDNWAKQQRPKTARAPVTSPEAPRRDELIRGYHERIMRAMASPSTGMTAVRLASITPPW